MEWIKRIIVNKVDEFPLFIEKGTIVTICDDENLTITKKLFSYFPQGKPNKYGISEPKDGFLKYGIMLPFRSGKWAKHTWLFGALKDINLLKLEEE